MTAQAVRCAAQLCEGERHVVGQQFPVALRLYLWKQAQACCRLSRVLGQVMVSVLGQTVEHAAVL